MDVSILQKKKSLQKAFLKILKSWKCNSPFKTAVLEGVFHFHDFKIFKTYLLYKHLSRHNQCIRLCEHICVGKI